MGFALGIGRGLQFRQRVTSTEGSKYISAATAAGYLGGSAACADVSFEALTNIA